MHISKEVGNELEEGRAYGNLGNAFSSLGDVKRSVELYELQFKFAKSVGNRDGEGVACTNLCYAYSHLGNVERAEEYSEISLKIVKEIGAIWSGGLYGNLGNANLYSGKYKTALDYYELKLTFAKKSGDRAA